MTKRLLAAHAARAAVLVTALASSLAFTGPAASAGRDQTEASEVDAREAVIVQSLPSNTEVAEARVGPHWCNSTSALVDDIHRLGGESVMRVELDGGRTLERYWNVNEEVTIEHGADGNSCLVELRMRNARR